jgi:hypothetical protein
MGVDLNRITQPPRTANPFRTDIYGFNEFSKLPTTDPRYQSQAEMRFQQNRADVGAYAYDSPMYTGGAPGNIVQSGPGRQFTGDEAMFVGDPRPESEDEGFMAKLRSSIADNPLFTGVASLFNPGFALAKTAGVGILDALGNMLPVNARAIQEKEGLAQGIAIDDIGRVAFQNFGIKADGKYGALSRDDPRNIFAGLNYQKIDQETIDKMIKTIEDGKMSPEGKKKRIDIVKQAWTTKQLADAEAQKIIDKRNYDRREKEREKIKEDLAKAGFGEAGAVGLSDDMDIDIRDYDDYATYEPPQAPPIDTARPDDKRDDSPASNPGFSAPSSPGQSPRGSTTGGGSGGTSAAGGAGAGGGSRQASSSGSTNSGRSDGGWGWKDGGLVKRKPYGDGGIVDLL